MDLLERIKLLSEKRSITISQLEDELGIPNNTIYQWKKRTPNVERLQKVADFFNVSIDYLLGRSDSEKSSNEKTSMAKQVMMRMNTDGLSEKELDEIESEMERFFSWRIEEIKRERGE
ncbi:helix-turn-helix domain-containing protein [Vagococcus fluvialis]|uniref:helix-turn-helix domain-containing protein n=1 Tax=Vagococcus fluvialis TaxID=2738 RepID=UPI003B21D2C4